MFHGYTFIFIHQTRMWADTQRDGRPAEYRWRRLRKFCNFITARRKCCISYGNSVCPSVCPSVRLSVCLSVTRRYCVKMTARSTVQFALLDSKMCLVL